MLKSYCFTRNKQKVFKEKPKKLYSCLFQIKKCEVAIIVYKFDI